MAPVAPRWSANNSVIRHADDTWSDALRSTATGLKQAKMFVDVYKFAVPWQPDAQPGRDRLRRSYDGARLTSTTLLSDGIDEHFIVDGRKEKPFGNLLTGLGLIASRFTEWAICFDTARSRRKPLRRSDLGVVAGIEGP